MTVWCHAGAVMHCFIGGQPPLNDLPVRNSLTRIVVHKQTSYIHFQKRGVKLSHSLASHPISDVTGFYVATKMMQ